MEVLTPGVVFLEVFKTCLSQRLFSIKNLVESKPLDKRERSPIGTAHQVAKALTALLQSSEANHIALTERVSTEADLAECLFP